MMTGLEVILAVLVGILIIMQCFHEVAIRRLTNDNLQCVRMPDVIATVQSLFDNFVSNEFQRYLHEVADASEKRVGACRGAVDERLAALRRDIDLLAGHMHVEFKDIPANRVVGQQ
jgi:hypothetical protein